MVHILSLILSAMLQNRIDGAVTVPLSWFSISSLMVLFTIGVAWGSLQVRIREIEKKQKQLDETKASKEEFISFRNTLDDIHEDVRELRRTMQSILARNSSSFLEE